MIRVLYPRKHPGQSPGRHPSKQRGFSLIEVLVSLVVTSIGLLGLAGLQANGLRNNTTAYIRTIATQQAYDITDRMRANRAGIAAGDYDTITATVADPGCTAEGGACTPAEMAAYDAYIWNSANAALLPGGLGTVTRAGDLFTVTLMWDEGRTGATGTGCDPANAADRLCLSFTLQP